MSPNKLIFGSKIKDIIVVNKNPANKLIPPREGFDSLLHLITTLFLFLIPKDLENRNNKRLLMYEIKRPPKKKIT